MQDEVAVDEQREPVKKLLLWLVQVWDKNVLS